MTPAELESQCKFLFGDNWRGKFAEAFSIDHSTRWRMMQRKEITGPVAVAVSIWTQLYRAFSVLPPETPADPFVTVQGSIIHLKEPLNIEEIGEIIFGSQWKIAMAKALDINPSTLWRHMTGNQLPSPVIAAIRAMFAFFELSGELPQGIVMKQAKTTKKGRSNYSRLVSRS